MAAGSMNAQGVIGYINVDITNGYNFVADQLDPGTNDLNTLIPSAPFGCKAYVWDVTNQAYLPAATYVRSWRPDYTVPFGKGFVVWTDTHFTNTFVGGVVEGKITNSIAGANEFSFLTPLVPMAGGLSTAHQFPAADGDAVYLFNTATQDFGDASIWFNEFGWYPAEPNLSVGQPFFVQSPGPARNWVIDFTVQGIVKYAGQVAAPSPAADNCRLTIRAGVVTLTSDGGARPRSVQFSRDSAAWTTVATGLTGTVWTGPYPGGKQGFYRLVSQ